MLTAVTHAHMMMRSPAPLKSVWNPYVTEDQKDYSYTSPLSPTAYTDGQYPCKGYHLSATQQAVVAEYTAGQAIDIQLDGSSIHNGGSCQISLSYDNGSTWKVIHSFEGSCPITANQQLSIKMPSDAPSGNNVLFAWSWLNQIGNRELYMNCARVNIKGVSTQPASWNMPGLYLANIFGPDVCRTIEGMDYTFPYPGTYLTSAGNYLSGAEQVTGGCPAFASGKPMNASTAQPAMTRTQTSAAASTSSGTVQAPLPTKNVKTVVKVVKRCRSAA